MGEWTAGGMDGRQVDHGWVSGQLEGGMDGRQVDHGWASGRLEEWMVERWIMDERVDSWKNGLETLHQYH